MQKCIKSLRNIVHRIKWGEDQTNLLTNPSKPTLTPNKKTNYFSVSLHRFQLILNYSVACYTVFISCLKLWFAWKIQTSFIFLSFLWSTRKSCTNFEQNIANSTKTHSPNKSNNFICLVWFSQVLPRSLSLTCAYLASNEKYTNCSNKQNNTLNVNATNDDHIYFYAHWFSSHKYDAHWNFNSTWVYK